MALKLLAYDIEREFRSFQIIGQWDVRMKWAK